MLESNKSIS